MEIFVSNFDDETDEEDLRALFGNFGTVQDVNLWINKRTWESAGYGFITTSDDYKIDRAIRKLNGRMWNGRRLKVSEARSRR